MHTRVLSIPFVAEGGGFADEGVNGWLESVDVVGVQSYFFEYDGQPWLTMIVNHRSIPDRSPAGVRNETGIRLPDRRKASPADDLSDEERVVYERLRKWRNEAAVRDKVTSFVILNNAQLAALARSGARTMAALGEVPGMGDKRLARYGAEILAALGVPAEAEPAEQTGSMVWEGP